MAKKKAKPKESPMSQRYKDAKQASAGALLLFKMGDFYEAFYDDAKLMSRILGLTLTSRDKGANAVPMAGFPHHQLEAYLQVLVGHGHRVAILEQVEHSTEPTITRHESSPASAELQAMLDAAHRVDQANPIEVPHEVDLTDGPKINLDALAEALERSEREAVAAEAKRKGWLLNASGQVLDCETECGNPAKHRVMGSASRAHDCDWVLCDSCHTAYEWGVKHGRYHEAFAVGGVEDPGSDDAQEEPRYDPDPPDIAYTVVEVVEKKYPFAIDLELEWPELNSAYLDALDLVRPMTYIRKSA